ncbi:MAG: cytochrome c biogenesis protein CcsA [Phycisphaeraceae bacterium]|nr:cytochrome c biogenesis protein CcsA [Phycisphaeraceae bacterium]
MLAILALLAAGASALAARRLWRGGAAQPCASWCRRLAIAAVAGSAGVLAGRVWMSHGWHVMQAHVDGLLLMSVLFGSIVIYLQGQSRLPGIGAFGYPVLTIQLAWAVCASRWSYHLFQFDARGVAELWSVAHLTAVYGSTLFVALAAIAGAMYLQAVRRLRSAHHRGLVHADPAELPDRPVSLERIERVIIRGSAIGFALLTLALASGLVILAEDAVHQFNTWYIAKMVLSVLAWAIYGVLMNVRHASTFRGARAAWLSIVGLVLMLATLALVSAMTRPRLADAQPSTPMIQAAQVEEGRP